MKRYVILDMATLKAKNFDYKEDMETALQTMRDNGMPSLKVLKWHPVASCYSIMESYELSL